MELLLIQIHSVDAAVAQRHVMKREVLNNDQTNISTILTISVFVSIFSIIILLFTYSYTVCKNLELCFMIDFTIIFAKCQQKLSIQLHTVSCTAHKL